MVVFDKNYDKALWLMIVGDKENRKLLANFIKVIPSKMYGYIQKSISENQSYAHIGHNKSIEFEPQIMGDMDGNIYEFEYGINFGLLIIKMRRYPVDKSCEETFELKLTPVEDVWFPYGLQYGESKKLGSFSHSYTKNNVLDNKCKSFSYGREYMVEKKAFDRVSVYSTDSKFKFGKVVSMRDIPLNVGSSIHSYKDSRDMKSLVRNKKRKFQ